MLKKIFVLCFCLTGLLVHAQTAAELNEQSKVFLEKKDYKNAVPLIKKAADMGNAEAQYNYAVCYQEGIGVPKSDIIANDLLLKSAKQGWVDAQFKLAYSYTIGRGVDKDDKQAFYWSLQCARQNDAECMWNVVGLYQLGRGTAKNTDSMLHWAIRLGCMPNPENLKISGQITSARLNLAKMYYAGDMIKKDLLKSYVWYLLFNESKRDFSIIVQDQQIEAIKKLETELTEADKEAAKKQAEAYLKSPLRNMANLYQQDK